MMNVEQAKAAMLNGMVLIVRARSTSDSYKMIGNELHFYVHGIWRKAPEDGNCLAHILGKNGYYAEAEFEFIDEQSWPK